MDFAVPADCRVKVKEGEKRDKYLYLVREQKKLWNMKVTVMPMVVGVHGTVPKNREKILDKLEIRGRLLTYPEHIAT